MDEYYWSYEDSYREINDWKQHKNPRQMSIDEYDPLFRKAVEIDRRDEYNRRKAEYYKKEALAKAKKQVNPLTFEDDYWDILAPHGWKIDTVKTECHLLCPCCDDELLKITRSATSKDRMWEAARNGVEAMRIHRAVCKAIPEGEAE